MSIRSRFDQVARIVALIVAASAAQADTNCIPPDQVMMWFPQHEKLTIGSIGGTVVGTSCTLDIPVTKGLTIVLKPEGPVTLSIGTIGYSRIDPLQPFQAKADGTIKLVVTRTTTRGADFTYKVLIELRKN